MSVNLLWLRRDLRLHDHAALSAALQHPGYIQPVFIFDTEILPRFKSPDDRRLTFIAETLEHIHQQLKKRGSGLLMLHGKIFEIIPKLVNALSCKSVFAAEDYEPDAIKRDKAVGDAISPGQLTLVKDQVIVSPTELTRDGSAYKVYTPYAKAWMAKTLPDKTMHYECNDHGRYADFVQSAKHAKSAGLNVLDSDAGIKAILQAIGYHHVPLQHWTVTDAAKRLDSFIDGKISHYAKARDFFAEEGTSMLSPYLRFGLISIRECYQKAAHAAQGETWVKELIWREFYAMILFHYPESVHLEWNPSYRLKIPWSKDKGLFEAWKEGRTGYPVVDAAMRQLLEIGWMHNRARMIVASFLTKHLLTDWRLGEEHFAQYLMDYEMASNVGGWQWASSTGTDAQPYFRVFNPYLQSQKFDPQGDYIRRYVPELRELKGTDIHHPTFPPKGYPQPIVEHEEARKRAIAAFKKDALVNAG